MFVRRLALFRNVWANYRKRERDRIPTTYGITENCGIIGDTKDTSLSSVLTLCNWFCTLTHPHATIPCNAHWGFRNSKNSNNSEMFSPLQSSSEIRPGRDDCTWGIENSKPLSIWTAPRTADRRVDLVWRLVDATECIAVEAENVIVDWFVVCVTNVQPNWYSTHMKQIVVHLPRFLVYLAMHTDEEIFNIDNRSQQFIQLFVGNVRQMRYVIFCNKIFERRIQTNQVFAHQIWLTQRMFAARISAFLSELWTVITFNVSMPIFLLCFPSRTATFLTSWMRWKFFYWKFGPQSAT